MFSRLSHVNIQPLFPIFYAAKIVSWGKGVRLGGGGGGWGRDLIHFTHVITNVADYYSSIFSFLFFCFTCLLFFFFFFFLFGDGLDEGVPNLIKRLLEKLLTLLP